MPESVLAVRREHIESFLSGGNGLLPCPPELLEIIGEKHLYLPRPLAEEDPAFKQIIPYIMLTQGDQCFITRRLNRGGEKRLHGLISLGVGGHINPSDEGESAPGELCSPALANGLRRELNEEVELETQPQGWSCGHIINDDSNPVGRVHLGLFVRMEVSGAVQVREREKLTGEFVKRHELCKLYDQMETWSRLIVEAMKDRES